MNDAQNVANIHALIGKPREPLLSAGWSYDLPCRDYDDGPHRLYTIGYSDAVCADVMACSCGERKMGTTDLARQRSGPFA